MKIGMMAPWNVSCGVSVHAELVGRAWVKMGHNLRVLAPMEWERPLVSGDEPYVKRCYGRGADYGYLFDEQTFLDDFDIFVIQDLEIMPMKRLLPVYLEIRKNAKTVLVVHEGKAPRDETFYQFEFDAVVCFDERYRNRFLCNIFPKERIHIIPYPCHPLQKGDKEEARRLLGLPLNKKILFNYGHGVFRHLHLLPTLERLAKNYPLVFLTITESADWYDLFEAVKKRYDFVELRRGPIPTSMLCRYLQASDALILHKGSAKGTVLASTIYLCLGAGRPILAHDTNFVENFNGEIMKYGNLTNRLEDIFEGRDNVRETLRKSEAFVKNNSSYVVAEKFIHLFKEISSEGVGYDRVAAVPRLLGKSRS